MRFKSYPKGGGMTSESAHSKPIIAIDTRWVLENGNRAQRRRIERELKRGERRK